MMEVSDAAGSSNEETRKLSLNGDADMEAEISLTVIPQSDDDDDDDDDDDSSLDNSMNNDNLSENSTDLMAAAMGDDVTAQLAAAGWKRCHLNGLCF